MKKIIFTSRSTLSYGTHDFVINLNENTDAVETVEILLKELKKWKDKPNSTYPYIEMIKIN